MHIKKFVFNMFCENTYLLWNDDKEAIIVDPGMMSDNENSTLAEFIKSHSLKPTHLIDTHAHVDHIAGNGFVESAYNLTAEGNVEDNYLAERVRNQAMMFGIPYNGGNLKIGKNLADNQLIKLGDETLKVIYVPGHTQGHIALYCKESDFLLSGDVLFEMSIGRTDLPGGDFNTLIRSIQNRLMVLPDATAVYPGHGNATTIGNERRNNPYLI